MKCDHCGARCRRRYFRVQNTETLEIVDLGSNCAWELYGMKAKDIRPVILPYVAPGTGVDDPPF